MLLRNLSIVFFVLSCSTLLVFSWTEDPLVVISKKIVTKVCKNVYTLDTAELNALINCPYVGLLIDIVKLMKQCRLHTQSRSIERPVSLGYDSSWCTDVLQQKNPKIKKFYENFNVKTCPNYAQFLEIYRVFPTIDHLQTSLDCVTRITSPNAPPKIARAYLF